jgi:hypothetical protein
MFSAFTLSLPSAFPTSPIIPVPITVPNKSVAKVLLHATGAVSVVGDSTVSDSSGWSANTEVSIELYPGDTIYAKSADNGATGTLHVLVSIS